MPLTYSKVYLEFAFFIAVDFACSSCEQAMKAIVTASISSMVFSFFSICLFLSRFYHPLPFVGIGPHPFFVGIFYLLASLSRSDAAFQEASR